MKRATKSGRNRAQAESLEETALYIMFLSEALFEVLAKKGLVTHDEMTQQMKKLRTGFRPKPIASDQF
jgi:hypothetical protein